MDYTPEKLDLLTEECSKANKEYAEYVHQEKVYQIYSQAYLASLIMKFKDVYPDESNVALETRAKSSVEWHAFVREEIHKLREAGRRWIKKEDCDKRWEAERSMMALRREEFKKL